MTNTPTRAKPRAKTPRAKDTTRPELRVSFSYKDSFTRPADRIDEAVYDLMHVHTTGPLVWAPCCVDSKGDPIMCPQRHMAGDVSSIDEARRLVAAIQKTDGIVELRGWYAEGPSGKALELTAPPTPEERKYFQAKVSRLEAKAHMLCKAANAARGE